MTHTAEIVDEDKKESSVRIEFELTVDGDEIGIPEADGDIYTQHFNLSYDQYRDSDRVQRHVEAWADQVLEQVREEYDPSEREKGKTFDL